MTNLQLRMPSNWLGARQLDQVLASRGDPNSNEYSSVTVEFPVGSKIMVDAGVMLLSLANQLAYCNKRVVFDFSEGESGTMGYLNRLGFFDHLHTDVAVRPGRPNFSGAKLYRGHNRGVIEYVPLRRNNRDQDLPTRFANSVGEACSGRLDRESLETAAFTVFSELIDNVYEHSLTPLDGFAALQQYRNGGRVRVVVSDSGKGIMETLRPTLDSERLRRLSDIDLVVEMFRQGVSRHGGDRGCGLKVSALQAIKFKANLDLRLPTSSVHLVPAIAGYAPNTAFCRAGLPLVWGTHIAFDFRLD